tara:strand:+ start:24189 stop:25517 length:1329 start_codon:yes stop_codon:yes gene_type:complete
MKSIFIFPFLVASCFAQSQILWDFEDPINIAENTFGNSCAQLLIDPSGNPQIIMGKPNEGLYFVSSDAGSFGIPQVIPTGDNISLMNSNGPNAARTGNKIGVVYKETSSGVSTLKFIQSVDNGISWEESIDVFSSENQSFSLPMLSYDSDGNPFIITKIGESPEIIEGFIRSIDGGLSFLPFVNVHSDLGEGVTCECCPSNPVYYNDRYYNIFRRNEDNLRDFWIVSSANGVDWDEQLDIDPINWTINGCPSSGAASSFLQDGQLLTAFMSGGNGSPKIYLNRFDTSNGTYLGTIALSTNQVPNQNNPSIASGFSHTAVAWEEFSDGVNVKLSIASNDNIPNGLVDGSLSLSQSIEGSNRYPDIEILGDRLFVIWQSLNEGTVKYVSGTITNSNGISELNYSKKLLKIVSILGQEFMSPQPNQVLLYVYDDGSVEKKYIIEE